MKSSPTSYGSIALWTLVSVSATVPGCVIPDRYRAVDDSKAQDAEHASAGRDAGAGSAAILPPSNGAGGNTAQSSVSTSAHTANAGTRNSATSIVGTSITESSNPEGGSAGTSHDPHSNSSTAEGTSIAGTHPTTIADVGNGGASAGGASVGGTSSEPSTAGAGGQADTHSTSAGSNAGGTGTSTQNLRVDCTLLLHMDELIWNGTTAEVLDDSGMGNHGTATATGAVTSASPAKFGRAGSFDGSGWVEVTHRSSIQPTNALTVAAWFRLAQLDGWERGIATKRWAWQSEDTFSIFVWGGEERSADAMLIYVDIDDYLDRFTSDPTKPLVANEWYHVVVVYDGTLPAEQRARLYVNGSLDGPPRYESSASIPVEYDGPLHVGDLQGGGRPFIGAIDEFALWRRALSPSEVTELYWASSPL